MPATHVRYRRFDHSEWEFGRLEGEPFVNPADPDGPRWVTVVPSVPDWTDAPTSLTVPICADRFRVVDEDYRTIEEGGVPVTDLQQAILDACLQLSKDAMAIFDAVESDELTIETARAVVRMGQSANDIALGVQTMVVTGMGMVRR